MKMLSVAADCPDCPPLIDIDDESQIEAAEKIPGEKLMLMPIWWVGRVGRVGRTEDTWREAYAHADMVSG
jgi:hypothetical protein